MVSRFLDEVQNFVNEKIFFMFGRKWKKRRAIKLRSPRDAL